MVATASSAAADISTHVGESVHSQFSASTEPVHNSVGVAVRLGSEGEPSTGNRQVKIFLLNKKHLKILSIQQNFFS